jgi:hypothetical protein
MVGRIDGILLLVASLIYHSFSYSWQNAICIPGSALLTLTQAVCWLLNSLRKEILFGNWFKRSLKLTCWWLYELLSRNLHHLWMMMTMCYQITNIGSHVAPAGQLMQNRSITFFIQPKALALNAGFTLHIVVNKGMYRQMRDVGSLESSTFLIRMHYTK